MTDQDKTLHDEELDKVSGGTVSTSNAGISRRTEPSTPIDRVVPDSATSAAERRLSD